jgi:hypothetical protein
MRKPSPPRRARDLKVHFVNVPADAPVPEVIIRPEGYDKLRLRLINMLSRGTCGNNGLLGTEEVAQVSEVHDYYPAVRAIQPGMVQYRREDVHDKGMADALLDTQLDLNRAMSFTTPAMRGDGLDRIVHQQMRATINTIDEPQDERYLGTIEDLFEWE